jgi:hypothetical protein
LRDHVNHRVAKCNQVIHTLISNFLKLRLQLVHLLTNVASLLGSIAPSDKTREFSIAVHEHLISNVRRKRLCSKRRAGIGVGDQVQRVQY